MFLLVGHLIGTRPGFAGSNPVILVYGDSLSTGYGLAPGKDWVTLLSKRLAQRGLSHRVVNASVTGETTSGGLSRIKDSLKRHRPALVILELGGNDGLRGLPLEMVRTNLGTILEYIASNKAKTLLVGLKLPPNYGLAYANKFEAMYMQLAIQYGVPVIPFLLEGLGTSRELYQSDGIHPTAEAQGIILETIWRPLEQLLLSKPKK